jgi:hypothetical protein
MAARIRLDYQLTGPARLGASLSVARQAEALDVIRPELDVLAEEYRQRVAEGFARKHGRTGETAQGTETKLATRIPGIMAIQAAVRFKGGVGYVVNQLPPHIIAARRAPDLFNPRPAPSRSVNTYSPFGPTKVVNWYQGGSESYSPDKTWYTAEDAWLALKGVQLLTRVGPQLRKIYSRDLGAGRVVITSNHAP